MIRKNDCKYLHHINSTFVSYSVSGKTREYLKDKYGLSYEIVCLNIDKNKKYGTCSSYCTTAKISDVSDLNCVDFLVAYVTIK